MTIYNQNHYRNLAKQLRVSINILTPLEDDIPETSTLRRAYRIYCATGQQATVDHVWGEIVERWGEPIDGQLPVGEGEKIGRFDLRWLETLARLAEFYGGHGERPRENGTREGEASLYRWMNNQRFKHRAGILAPEHVAILDQHIPGWFEASETPDQTLIRRVNEWARFTEKYGERPRYRGAREDEASLYTWIGEQRKKHRAGALSPKHMAILDQRIPGWSGSAETSKQVFVRRVNEWVRFTEKYGGRPRQSGTRGAKRGFTTGFKSSALSTARAPSPLNTRRSLISASQAGQRPQRHQTRYSRGGPMTMPTSSKNMVSSQNREAFGRVKRASTTGFESSALSTAKAPSPLNIRRSLISASRAGSTPNPRSLRRPKSPPN